MKILLIIFTILLTFINAIAQTDSLEQKLEKYKALHDKGLIDDAEYKSLKAAVLKSQKEAELDNDTIALEKLRKTANGNIGAGSALTVLGGVGIGAAIYISEVAPATVVYSGNTIQYKFLSKYYNNIESVNSVRKNYTIMFGIFGGIFTVGGIYWLVRGTTEMSIYHSKKGDLDMVFSPNGPTLTYSFK